MRAVIYIIVFLLMGLQRHGQALADTTLGMHLEQFFFNEGTYSLDVSYGDASSSKLRIYCTDKCHSKTAYSETISGLSLSGAFGTDDTFITRWAAGSINWLIIYRIHGGMVTKVLQQPSRALPDFESTPDGRRVIALRNDTSDVYSGKELYGKPARLTKADHAKIRAETTSLWLWNGSTYVPYRGRALSRWETIR